MTPKPQSLEIQFPDPQSWSVLIRDLKLTDVQANILCITIIHVIEDLTHYKSVVDKTPTRPFLVERLKAMEQALENLRAELDRSSDIMDYLLPHDTLEQVGELLTFSAMKEALGEDVSPEDTGIVIGNMIQSNNTITMMSLEDHYSKRRQVLGLKKGHIFLKYFIEHVHAPLSKWVEIDKLNIGGRPPNMTRYYLIYRLAEAAAEIIGRRAGVGKSGPFVRLCAQVLPACGLSADGIDSAVPEIVKEMRGSKPAELLK
jgi:hypothetical protein